MPVTLPGYRAQRGAPRKARTAAIGIHAGRIAAGLPDVHDGSAVIREVSEQIGGFFRKTGDSGDLELGQTSKDIRRFVGAK